MELKLRAEWGYIYKSEIERTLRSSKPRQGLNTKRPLNTITRIDLQTLAARAFFIWDVVQLIGPGHVDVQLKIALLSG